MALENNLKQIISDECCVDIAEIDLSSNLIDDLGFDELDLIEVVMAIEEQLDIEVSDEEVEKIHTFGNLLKTVEKIKEVL